MSKTAVARCLLQCLAPPVKLRFEGDDNTGGVVTYCDDVSAPPTVVELGDKSHPTEGGAAVYKEFAKTADEVGLRGEICPRAHALLLYACAVDRHQLPLILS